MDGTQTRQGHDAAQILVMRLGLGASGMCFYLGYPCAAGKDWVLVAFRATCIGYFSCNLCPLLLRPSPLTLGILRLALIVHSLSSWLVSAFWCVGFGEWCILMLMVHLFQIFGTMILVRNHVPHHVLFTFIGSIVSYMSRPDEPKMAIDAKAWAAATVTTVIVLVAGMWYSKDNSIQFLQRRLEAVCSILAMSPEEFEKRPSSSSTLTMTPPTIRFNDMAKATDQELQVNTWIPGLELLECVGQGSFGKVHFCKWHGENAAVKIMNWKGSRMSKVDPVREAELCKTLVHPNLVQTYTFFFRNKGQSPLGKHQFQEIWIIQEWCDLGTLSQFCRRSASEGVPDPECKKILQDICKATAYLHASGVIHGDLTPNNVLLKAAKPKKEVTKTDTFPQEYVCKICDFGLARVLEEGITELLTSQLGTVSHMPPELIQLEDKRLSKKTDIYAVGMLLYEVTVGEIPYRGMMIPQIILFVAKGKKLCLPECVNEPFREIYDRCTHTDPSERPSADQLVALFQ